MTDTRPICPIPDDAQVGDIVEFRDGQRKPIERIYRELGEYHVTGYNPGGVHKSGNNWFYDVEQRAKPQWDCVAFYLKGRKPALIRERKTMSTKSITSKVVGTFAGTVLTVIYKNSGDISTNDIIKKLKRKAGPVSVYKALNVLVSAGFIIQFHDPSEVRKSVLDMAACAQRGESILRNPCIKTDGVRWVVTQEGSAVALALIARGPNKTVARRAIDGLIQLVKSLARDN